MSAFPLDYASGRVPQFSATLMPGLVRNYDHAQRLNKSDFMKDIKALVEKSGAVVIADAWLAGGFASKKQCITSPDRSEEHTSELQSLMRIPYAVFCLKIKKKATTDNILHNLNTSISI